MSFAGKVVVISGVCNSLGQEIAMAFAKQQALLALAGEKEEQLPGIGERCKRSGAEQTVTIPTNEGNAECFQNVIIAAVEMYGHVDILINNAGYVGIPGGIEESRSDSFDLVFSKNLKGYFYATQAAIPHLEKSQGNVVNISSYVSKIVDSEATLYSMAKNCTDHFTKVAALELAKKNIRVNAVNPGFMWMKKEANKQVPEDIIEEMDDMEQEKHPLGKTNITPEEVVNAIFYLVSDNASAITGTCLSIDRGRFLTGQ